MFTTSATTPLPLRTVGVVTHSLTHSSPGYTLLSSHCDTYLLNNDGQVVHEWHSDRPVFCSYLFPSGNLLRDGSDTLINTSFRTGGASGYVEEVTWEGDRVWYYTHEEEDVVGSMYQYLSHHDLEILPNGNVLLLVWEKKSECVSECAGRRPELIPDKEVWDNLVVEIKPDRENGTAEVVWKWCVSV